MLLNQAIQSFRDYIEMIDRSQSTITCYTQELGHFNDFLQVKHNGPVYLEDIVSTGFGRFYDLREGKRAGFG